MKLASICSVMIGCGAAAGILASTSPAHALTWTLNNVKFVDNGTAIGSFNYDEINGTYSNISIQVSGALYNRTFTDTDLVISDARNLVLEFQSSAEPQPRFPYQGIELSWLTNLPITGGTVELDTFNAGYYLSDVSIQQTSPANRFAAISGSSVTTVPFEVPGGATIPTVGSLFALGVMRSAKKRIAFKTRIANPMSEAVS